MKGCVGYSKLPVTLLFKLRLDNYLLGILEMEFTSGAT